MQVLTAIAIDILPCRSTGICQLFQYWTLELCSDHVIERRGNSRYLDSENWMAISHNQLTVTINYYSTNILLTVHGVQVHIK